MTVSLSDLIAQKEALERQIQAAQSASRQQAMARVRALMDEHGLTATDVVAKSPARSATAGIRKVAAKYRDPASGATWTGRGLKPKWLVAALDTGKTLQEFVI